MAEAIPQNMRAVAYHRPLPSRNPESLVDIELPVPEPGPYDLLVRVEAVSVNPVDVKVRSGSDPGGVPRVLGYDAAGVVVAVGSAVTRFEIGDEVYYAGSIDRPGTNAQYHLVDERITGHMPTSLGFAAAAALPLTTITAWESLFDRFGLQADSTGTLVVVGAAGGVGSIMLQLARALTGVTIIGTASRPESQQWVLDRGAHHVIDHHSGLAQQVADLAPDGVEYIFSPHSAGNIGTYAEMLRPGGHVTAIDEPEGLDLLPLKTKSISWHWELMFTRPMFAPTDAAQHALLEQVSRLVDEGVVRTTMTGQLTPINAENLRQAHSLVEGGSTIGKIVLSGFAD